MENKPGFEFCVALDGVGSAKKIEKDHCDVWRESEETVWFHLDSADGSIREWLESESNLSSLTIEMLLSEDTRPRITQADGGMMICFRTVNCNPGDDADDMVSLRLWITRNRILSIRRRRVEAATDLKSSFEQGHGPLSSAEFLVFLCDSISLRIAAIVADIDEGVDNLEDEILDTERGTLRSRILKYRRMIIGLRKFLVPERETFARLQTERADWLTELNRVHLRESAERIGRCLDDLDATRDRAAMAQEELNARLSEQMNQTIFMMSIVATIFLPLGLLTGLLGINVGGVPGTDSPWAFLVVCAILLVISVALYLLFKKKHIITTKKNSAGELDE